MGLQVYRIGEYNHRAEEQQFQQICSILRQRFDGAADNCLFIGNYNISGVELDALLITAQVVAVIEFKNWGGEINARENGSWQATNGQIAGGANGKNPYVQMRTNKSRTARGLAQFLNRDQVEVQGMIVFNQPAHIDASMMSNEVMKWLRICDNDHFMETFDSLSPLQAFCDNSELRSIPQQLQIEEFKLVFSTENQQAMAPSSRSFSHGLGVECFQRIQRILDHKEKPWQERYDLLYFLYIDMLNERTLGLNMTFANPYAKQEFLCQEYGIDNDTYLRINDFRVRYKYMSESSENDLIRNFLYDVKALCTMISVFYEEPIPHPIEQALPYRYPERRRRKPFTNYMRVTVKSWDSTRIYTLDVDTGEPVTVLAQDTNNNFGDFSYILGLIREGSQLNLVRPRIQDDMVAPELIIFEPDNLVNVSAIAQCFASYDNTALAHFFGKIKGSDTTSPMLLGNFASQLLDEAINNSENPRSYNESVKEFFKNNTLKLATCADIGIDFHNQAKAQRVNIINMVNNAQQEIGEFDIKKVMLEPSFYCEMLGLQGRMDLLQTDMRVLMEQKSGKRDEFYSRHKEPHYVQMLLYQALLHYNYGLPNHNINSFLYYSKYPNGLMKEGPAPKLLFEAIRMRNNIAALDFALSEGIAPDILDTLVPSALRKKTVNEKFWMKYVEPELDAILSPIHQASEVEKAYFYRFLEFIAKENILSKLGTSLKGDTGFATMWTTEREEKQAEGNILEHLTIDRESFVQDNANGISRITLNIPQLSDDILPNFRSGDIVALYSYDKRQCPDVRQTMVLRATISEFTADHITLNLRAPQKNFSVFHLDDSNCVWAIEHDFMESSYNGLFHSLHMFLLANKDRKQLILGQRKPVVDHNLRLCRDYQNEEHNELVLKSKQAQDYFLLIGPPGTGKTSYGLLNILTEELYNPNSSVLLLSYTNRAVDEICSKLKAHQIDFMRLGKGDSIAPEYRDNLIGERVGKARNTVEIYEIVKNTRVVVSTTTSMLSNLELFKLKKFSLAIVDEASQILEPHLLGILSAKHGNENAIDKFVLIGDQKQLPAVVLQNETASRVTDPELAKIELTNCRNSLFERLLKLNGNNPDLVYQLKHHARMHNEIAEFPNQEFYQGQLVSIPLSHQDAVLSYTQPAANQLESLLMVHRLLFFNVENHVDDSGSEKVNPAEADLIAKVVKSHYDIYRRNGKVWDSGKSLGVIVPYRHQIATVKKEIQKFGIAELNGITIDTVERYQGSERDVIVYGFTIQREHQLNFLTGNLFMEGSQIIDRKLNVAITRAREQLVVVGNQNLLKIDYTFSRLIDHITTKGGFVDMMG